jgi:hypothetical protein
MANRRVNISIEWMDLYQQNVVATGDDQSDPADDWSRDVNRIHPSMGKEAIKFSSEIDTTTDPDVYGRTNGNPDYVAVQGYSDESNGIAIGGANKQKALVFIRHTGFNYDASAANKQGEACASNASVLLRREIVQGGGGLDSVYTDVAHIRPGQFIFMDSIPAYGSNLTLNLRGVLSTGTVCIDYFMIEYTG